MINVGREWRERLMLIMKLSGDGTGNKWFIIILYVMFF